MPFTTGAPPPGDNVIEIDGSHGEGGGQILRTSLALSALTGTPVRIRRIRSSRKAPGLKPQHLISAKAAAQICGGRLVGAQPNSTELCFHPGEVQAGRHAFDVGTAGSTSLVLQTLLPPLAFAGSPSRILVNGGTHVAWSPPADYLRDVFLPTVATMGLRAKFHIRRSGFYPIGGGEIEAIVEPSPAPLKPLRIKERGRLKSLRVISTVARLPLSIAERQLNRATNRLAEQGLKPQGEPGTVESPGKGSFCFIRADFENVRAGFSALGELGKRAERVADEAVEEFIGYWNDPGALDRHLADQVVLYMALAKGESIVTLSEVTEHLKTNIWVIEQFLPIKFALEVDPSGRGGTLRVAGTAFRGQRDEK
jgi:RNA 3'-terminal phosphate cyclase (ATP)